MSQSKVYENNDTLTDFKRRVFVPCELSVLNIRNSSTNSVNRNNSECCLEVQLLTLGEYGWDGIEKNAVFM